MNELKININLDNDAFYPQPRENKEVARILMELAEKIEKGIKPGILHDINGNKVGQVTYFYEVKGA